MSEDTREKFEYTGRFRTWLPVALEQAEAMRDLRLNPPPVTLPVTPAMNINPFQAKRMAMVPRTEAQFNLMKKLNYTGDTAITKLEASRILDMLIKKGNRG